MIQPFFTNYTNWEDWQNGMYRDISRKEHNNYVDLAILVLCDPEIHMNRVTKEWYYSTKQNLSDTKSNRKSWLGQASCCISYQVPEHCTREAWCKLTSKQRINANRIAQKVINKWEESIYPNLFSMLQENE